VTGGNNGFLPRKTKAETLRMNVVKFWGKREPPLVQEKPLFIASITSGNPVWLMKTLEFYETHLDMVGRRREKTAIKMDYSRIDRVEETTFNYTFSRNVKVTFLAAMTYLVEGGKPLQILLESAFSPTLTAEPIRNAELGIQLSAWLRKKLGDSKYLPLQR